MEHFEWIDRWKGILILFVVLGHVLGGGWHLADSTTRVWLQYLYLTIYHFHMPAFFLLAGMTFSGINGTWGEWLGRKFHRLITPYLCFGIFSAVIWWAMNGSVGVISKMIPTSGHYGGMLGAHWWYPIVGLLHGGGAPHGEGFRMNSVLWFLPCMFSTLVCFRSLIGIGCIRDCTCKNVRNLLNSTEVILIVVFILAAWTMTFLRCPDFPWGGSKVPYYLLFMLVGFKVRRLKLSLRIRGGWWTAFLLSAIVYLVMSCVYPNPIVVLRKWFWFPCFLPLAFLGIFVSALCAWLLPWKWLSVCGDASMTIMLLHKFVVMFMQWKLKFINDLFKTGFLSAFIGTLLITVVAVIFCLFADKMILRFCPWAIGSTVRSGRFNCK